MTRGAENDAETRASLRPDAQRNRGLGGKRADCQCWPDSPGDSERYKADRDRERVR